ncbi:MAG: polyphenol oxidase family protein [Polyangiaceae bacterium]|nr:polyphenol oxidase family protein [Polyangiaceae bacterium]
MPLLWSPVLRAAGFRHGFPERGLGDADLRAALGVLTIAQARQVHGARAVEATEAEGAEADALVARAPVGDVGPGADSNDGAIAVGVRVADCVPVLLADVRTGAVAAVHAGWRGVVAGVVSASAALLGARPSDVVAAIGPCIGACCFEVGADVAEAIERAAAPGASSAPVVVRRDGPKAFVDLRAAVRAQLAALGVGGERVDDIAGCTKHEAGRFHSFRRDGQSSGRMLAAIASRASRRYG